MKRLIVVFAILAFSSSALAAPCAEDDLRCLKASLGEQAEKALSLARELESTNKLLQLEQQKSKALESAYGQLKDTLPGLSKAIEAVKPRWYDSPWLWLGIGTVLGALTVIVSIAAAGQTLVGLAAAAR
jgi:septal ring factor EnvC (AmiA/AmiB activator)